MNEFNRPEETIEAKEINLLDYWIVVIKRKWLIAAIIFVVLVIAGINTYTARPIYTAKGMLQIEKEPTILSFQDVFQVDTIQQDYFQTQYKLLQSRTLADRTIEALKLYENPEYIGKPEPGRKPPDKTDSFFRSKLIDAFLARLIVSPIRQTRLVEVSFKSGSPKWAADGVNALFDAFVAMSIESKYSATEQATEFLTMQIASLKSDIERKEQQLGEYAASKNIVALSNTETTIVDKLSEMNKALTAAQIERITREAYYNEIKNASADYLPEAMANPMVTKLREEYGRLSRDFAQKEMLYLPDFPEYKRAKADMENVKKQLDVETQNLVKAAYSEYQAALLKELSLRQEFNVQKQESIHLNSNAISYNTLRNEVANNKLLLDTLVRRESETGVSARLKGTGVSNIRIVDKAEIPAGPSAPNKKRNMLLALFVGMMGGLGLAFLLDYMDNSIKSAHDVEKYAGTTSLGIIPVFDPQNKKRGYGYGYGYGYSGRRAIKSLKKGAKKAEKGQAEGGGADKSGAGGTAGDAAMPAVRSIELITLISPKSNISESYRSIRTAVLLSSAVPGSRNFVVSSSLPSEGKSATVANLGVAMAQAGKRVLLIDSDLRKPRLHRIFKIKNLNGLTNYLTGSVDLKELIKPTMASNLFLINAGPVPPNPAELLGSEKMGAFLAKLKPTFDYILMDSPPILAVTDAQVLGPFVDGVILIVWGGKTPREALKRAKEKLDQTGIKTLGVILNRLDVKAHDYYYRRHYYYDYYQHREDV